MTGNTDAAEADLAVDEEALRAHLAEELGRAEQFEVEPLAGGSSNDTLLVRRDDREFVLRRPPAGEPAPGLLHDVTREYEALTALSDTWVPVPEPVFARGDAAPGGPFYLMERVEGEILGGEEIERFATPARRQRVGCEMVDTLAKLHALDVDRLAFDAEAPEADLEGAVADHTDRLEAALDRTAERRPLPELRRVGDWLAANVPEPGGRALCHGDFKPDNTLFAPAGHDASRDERPADAREQETPPRVAAVLDWELCGLGDPLADLGWLLAYWTQPDDPDPVTDAFTDRYEDHDYYPTAVEYVRESSTFMTREGYPSRRELVARYERNTGVEYRDDRFYRVLALYKLAAICERFFALYLRDPETAKPTYPLMELLVPLIGRRAAAIVDGDTPL